MHCTVIEGGYEWVSIYDNKEKSMYACNAIREAVRAVRGTDIYGRITVYRGGEQDERVCTLRRTGDRRGTKAGKVVDGGDTYKPKAQLWLRNRASCLGNEDRRA